MAARRIVFGFGKPPFKLLADHLAQDSDFLDDARYIVSLDQDGYSRLVTQLAKSDSFLSRSVLTAIVCEALGGHENSDRIASILYRMAAILHGADMPATAAMDALGKAIEEKARSLEPQERRTLIDRLRTLAAQPIGLAKQYKALQLVAAIGAELDDFRIICDIRPIFDQDRERIDGAIPLTILRLEYTAPEGESKVIEVRLTEKQIEEFKSKMATAQRKLRLIKELLTRTQLPIPGTESTVAGEE